MGFAAALWISPLSRLGAHLPSGWLGGALDPGVMCAAQLFPMQFCTNAIAGWNLAALLEFSRFASSLARAQRQYAQNTPYMTIYSVGFDDMSEIYSPRRSPGRSDSTRRTPHLNTL